MKSSKMLGTKKKKEFRNTRINISSFRDKRALQIWKIQYRKQGRDEIKWAFTHPNGRRRKRKGGYKKKRIETRVIAIKKRNKTMRWKGPSRICMYYEKRRKEPV